MKHLKSRLRFNSINESTKESKKITKDDIIEFWNFVDEADWRSDINYERIQKLLKTKYKKERKMFDNIFQHFKNEAYTKFENDWLGEPGFDVSDDGYSDLIADVVGRGEEFYNNADAKILQTMASYNDYDESFSYCFH